VAISASMPSMKAPRLKSFVPGMDEAEIIIKSERSHNFN
jgi:hypothetical protein